MYLNCIVEIPDNQTGILDIPVRWKRLSGVLESACPDRGNHCSGVN